ncbi:MAG: molybdate ABC transporter substrate-binding protein [Pseudomonadota bacterium]
MGEEPEIQERSAGRGAALTPSRRAALSAIAGAALLGAPARLVASAQGPLVFAAASLKTALDRIAAHWRDSGRPAPRLSYAASSALARQIELGAPASLFISAHPLWTRRLLGLGALDAASLRSVAGNRLALIAAAGQAEALPRDAAMDETLALAAALGPTGRLATGRVESVPLGIYAKEALGALRLWDQLRGRLAEAQNARIALSYVARGEAPLGVVYATDARLATTVRRIGLFPRESHRRILYPAALTAEAAAESEAAAFLAHLSAPSAEAIFAELGFERPAAEGDATAA